MTATVTGAMTRCPAICIACVCLAITCTSAELWPADWPADLGDDIYRTLEGGTAQ